MTPEMSSILASASEGNSTVSITRPREGVWPSELRAIRLLEKDEYLKRVRLVDSPAEGTVTAVYILTPKGNRAAVEQRRPQAPVEHAGSVGTARQKVPRKPATRP